MMIASKLKKLQSFRDEPFTKNDIGSKRDVEITNDGSIIVYICGDWAINSTKGNIVGIGVFWGDNHPDNVSRLLDERQAENKLNLVQDAITIIIRAETQAAITAIRQAENKLNLVQDAITIIIRAETQAAITAIRQAKKNGYKRIVIRTGADNLINILQQQKDNKDLLDVMTGMESVIWEEIPNKSYGHKKAVQLARNGTTAIKSKRSIYFYSILISVVSLILLYQKNLVPV